MNKSHTRVRRSPEQWRKLLDELETSGIDRKTFCQRYGLRVESLRRAQHRLAGRDALITPFVELMTPEPPACAVTNNGWDIELELGDGLVLRLARR